MTGEDSVLRPLGLSPAMDVLRARLPFEVPEASLRTLAESVDCLDAGLEGLVAHASVASLEELVAAAKEAPRSLAPACGQAPLRAAIESVCNQLSPVALRDVVALSVIDGPFDGRLAEATASPAVLGTLQRAISLGLATVTHAPGGSLPPMFRLLQTVRRHLAPSAPRVSADRFQAALDIRAGALVDGWWLKYDGDTNHQVRVLRPLLRQQPRPSPICRLARDLIDAPRVGASERLASLALLDPNSLPPTRRAIAHLALADAHRVAGDVAAAKAALARVDVLSDPLLNALHAIGASQLEVDQGQYGAAVTRLERVLAATADTPECLLGWLALSISAPLMHVGRPSDAMSHLEQALAIATRSPDWRLRGSAQGNLGVLMLQRDRRAAHGYLLAASDDLKAVEDLARLAVANVNLAVLELAEGRPHEAESLLAEALSAYRQTENRRGAAVVASNLGELLHDRCEGEDLRLAEATLDAGMKDAEASGAIVLGAVLASQKGRLLLELGRWSEASRHLSDAVKVLDPEHDAIYGALANGALAVCEGLLGDTASALRRIEKAQAAVYSTQADLLLGSIDALRAAVHAALAATAAARSDDVTRRRHEALTHQLLEMAAGREDGSDRRIADRVARGLLTLSADSMDVGTQELLVAPGSAWFRFAETPVDLSRRPTLARVLDALVEHWPKPLPPVLLFACAWPEEKAQRKAQHERVRAAVAALRKKGLRDVLERSDRGYCLASDLRIRRWPPAPQAVE